MPTDPANPIDRDAPCIACGYNLRGLAYDRDCPECGRSIASWVRADRFAALDPAWLARMCVGSRLLNAGVVLSLLLIYPGMLVAAIGLWPMTQPPRPHGETAADRATRLSARWALGLGLLISTLTLLAAIIHTGGQARRLYGDWLVYDALLITAGVLIVLGLASTWLHLSQLARRIPDGDLARGFARLRRDWFIAGGIFITIALITNLVNALGGNHQLYRFGEIVPALMAGIPLVVTLLWLWWQTLKAAALLQRTLRRLIAATR